MYAFDNVSKYGRPVKACLHELFFSYLSADTVTDVDKRHSKHRRAFQENLSWFNFFEEFAMILVAQPINRTHVGTRLISPLTVSAVHVASRTSRLALTPDLKKVELAIRLHV